MRKRVLTDEQRLENRRETQKKQNAQRRGQTKAIEPFQVGKLIRESGRRGDAVGMTGERCPTRLGGDERDHKLTMSGGKLITDNGEIIL